MVIKIIKDGFSIILKAHLQIFIQILRAHLLYPLKQLNKFKAFNTLRRLILLKDLTNLRRVKFKGGEVII